LHTISVFLASIDPISTICRHVKKIPPPVGESSGPGGIRALALFSAIDEQVGEKGEKAVYYVYYVPKSPDCISISVPELFPDMHRYEARKGDPQAQSTGE
jgi:hypothetical protein